MPSLETLIETITDCQITGATRTLVQNRAEPILDEHVVTPLNPVQVSPYILQPNVGSNLIPLGTHEAELLRRLNEMEDLIKRIPGMPTPIKKSSVNLYVDSPFTDNIALVEMPQKFGFSNIKLYNRTTDPDDHIAQYKQRMFTTAIPRDMREACMCKGFRSSLIELAL